VLLPIGVQAAHIPLDEADIFMYSQEQFLIRHTSPSTSDNGS